MIYKVFTGSDFANGMIDHFSYDASIALYNYLDDSFGDMEFDAVELSCTYSEYASIDDASEDIGVSKQEIRDALVAEGYGFIIINSDLI